MKVRATQVGYYGEKRRRVGDVFNLKPMKYWKRELDPKTKLLGPKKEISVSAKEQFSDFWMEAVESSAKVNEATSIREFGPNIGKKVSVARAAHEPSVEEDATGDQDVI